MTKKELLYALALQKASFIGDITAKKLIRYCGSAEAVFKASDKALENIEGIGSLLINNLKDTSCIKRAEKELRFIEDHQIDYSFYLDEDYPEKLKHCPDGPILLFKKGNINWENKRIISVVGTRQMSPQGAAFCEQFIEMLSPLSPLIISGFAYGIDITAQRAAVKNRLQTIGCLAHGLNQIYPKPHKKYMAEIENNGGFITDLWSSSHPLRENFLKRNRIIAGMSEATVVIESGEKGGSLITADIANSYDREVFAVPGRPGDKFSIGCNNLIKSQKAHLLNSAADLIYMLGWEIESELSKPKEETLTISLEDNEKTIYRFLKENGKELMDIIALKCNLPVYKVATVLLGMELKGIIRPLPGKYFEIT